MKKQDKDKPDPSGFWSRGMTEEHRQVYILVIL
ncbi:hypothetical protein AHX05_19595 [Salmonella enterica subsp. indica]|nr:type II toxin-antitoxin system YoeB family toxin [Salmonella enterica]EAW1720969.1 hypothetical protein [Salmonella enterica subsp. indica]EEC4249902.1 hypothetical protein [Salmonella enterica subsp. diarizonae]HBZ5824179.1 type II toxin-antitoxin system YoeB family toxin [Salmonella enterica]